MSWQVLILLELVSWPFVNRIQSPLICFRGGKALLTWLNRRAYLYLNALPRLYISATPAQVSLENSLFDQFDSSHFPYSINLHRQIFSSLHPLEDSYILLSVLDLHTLK